MRCDLLFEMAEGEPGADYLPQPDSDEATDAIPASLRREGPDRALPQVSEQEVIRHFNRMVARNFGLNSGPYLLGGRTMRHAPRVADTVAGSHSLMNLHPLQPAGAMWPLSELHDELIGWLKALLGMDEMELEAAGEGEADVLVLDAIARHADANRGSPGTLLVASTGYFAGEELAARLGFTVERVAVGVDGLLQASALADRTDVAALILSVPDCYGRADGGLATLIENVHAAGGLAVNYARNLAGVMTYWNPGGDGIDLIVFPLNGVFGVPHCSGGQSVYGIGGRGAAADALAAANDGGTARNWPVLVRTYVYLALLGWAGLQRATEDAVIAANYLAERLRSHLAIVGRGRCLNQFVATIPGYLGDTGIHAADIARRMLDSGVHPPAVDELSVLHECLTFQPTESATHVILNGIAELIGGITIEVSRNFSLVRGAPHMTPVGQPRVPEAAEEMMLAYLPGVIHTEDTGCGCPMCAR